MNQPEILKKPLAYNGDKSTLPELPVADSSQFSLSEGFPLLSATPKKYGGIAPKREDFNSIAYLLSLHTLFLQSGNKYKYSPLLDYNIGATVLGSDNALYYCIKDNNIDNPQEPISETSYWIKLVNQQGFLNVGASFGVLSITNGGTGATTPETAWKNFGGGKIGKLDIIDTENIKDNAITPEKLAEGLYAVLPVGFIYMQLRGQETPDVLFKTSGTWQDISNTYAGEFFRAVGGNSATFGSIQTEGLPTFNVVTDRAVQGQNKVLPQGERLTAANKGHGAYGSNVSFRDTSAIAIGTGNTSFATPPYPYFVPNNAIYGASSHVTPYNSAIRIWKKIK